ncbi:capsule assembly Wzi family protein [Pedobacter sp. JCM 36344]|uniref:capsule assembly Wzi family protein n=1 Tax=Pedobacter sp. JCM 36344 TaxID=3374280 RepID=UPI00397C98A4
MQSNKVSAQVRSLKSFFEVQAIASSTKDIPFWMRSNQYGSVPITGLSSALTANFMKEYESSAQQYSSNQPKLFDWGFGFESRVNVGQQSTATIIEAYGKAKFNIFQLKVGRTKDVMGLNGDTILSSGNFAQSGNALGIPKIELSIPSYWRLPFFKGLFSLKGSFSHGWVGSARILDSIESLPPSKEVFYINNNMPKTFFHQKSLYIRLGKANWNLNLIGGFNHQVFWGNERSAYGSNFKLSPLETFFYVATGKAYGSLGVPKSKIGNQIGSIDVGAEYKFNSLKLLIYRQNFYDVGALSKLANIRDGLNGAAIENIKMHPSNGSLQWKKMLIELFYSKDQAGYPWSIPTKSGDEDYYNSFYYKEGWSYKGSGLGNPLISKRDDVRDGQAEREIEYFSNNRVIAVHLGFEGEIYNWSFKTKLTQSWNYGTFGTSKYGSSTGSIRSEQNNNIFKSVAQSSYYLEALKNIGNKYQLGFVTAFDNGHLLRNSFGLATKLKRSF